MSQEEYLAAGEKHVAKDEEVNLEFLLKNQNRLNGHVSMLLKTFNAGADWNHQARLRATKLTHSLSVAPLYLLFKDHKGWTIDAGGPPPTRPVASAGGGQDDHLSETISTVLEPVANKMWGGMETTSTPDFVSKIAELNKKEFNCEEIDLAEIDRALDEKTNLHEDPNQMSYSSSQEEECVDEVSIPEEELEEEDVDYSTPCPWQTGKEDCECSGVLNDSSEESLQKDGKQDQPATINGLSCRWAGTEFDRVAIACIRMEGWCERGWTLKSEILEWLSSNSEAKLVEEAAEMVDGLDTLWEKEGRDKTDEGILEDAVEIMTAILIGWFTDRGMVGQDTDKISIQRENNIFQEVSIHKEQSAQQPELDQQAEVSILRVEHGHHSKHEHDEVPRHEAKCMNNIRQEVEETEQESNMTTPVRLSRAANMRKVREESRKLGNARKQTTFQDPRPKVS